MIFCVVPEALAPDLLDKLEAYYADDPNVTVIVDRRHSERRGAAAGVHSEQRETRDRRRPRVAGDFPRIDPSPAVVPHRAG